MKQIRFTELDDRIKDEIKSARRAAEDVVPKGRDVRVGALLVAENGKKYVGANIARERYNNSTCAERMALDRALNDGIVKIERIIVIGLNEEEPFEEVVAPCGACRQMIFEAVDNLGQEDTEMVLVNSKMDKVVVTSLRELLPLAYKSSRRVLAQ